ncbi:MAG: hypothetical protein FJ395_13105 [Verrucomicrobia bacterium]|nr:hypothetical protein [Verrucomicrobiota bacterium]
MDIKFSCYNCGQHIVIDESEAGTKADCPTCGVSLVLPFKSATTETAPPPVPSPSSDKTKDFAECYNPQYGGVPPATQKCPFCAEMILADAIKCKHCGEFLDGKPVATDSKTAGEYKHRLLSEVARRDAQGDLRCPVCNGKQFEAVRSIGSKLTFGLAPVDRVRCATCGTTFKRG